MKKSTTENEKKMDKTFDKKELKKEGKTSKNQHSSEANNQKVIADLKIKLKEAEDKLLRELAENENLRKRHEKESQENLKYAIRNFSTELLSVTDNFQRALSSRPRENLSENVMLKNLVIGLEAVEKEIIGAIGVIGPMRINYAKIIPVVDYTAKLIGEKFEIK